MPEKKTLERARRKKREGKAPSTQAGEFVREEIHHIRSGKHGARSAKQAIAIGLSKARRAGVKLRPPARGHASQRVRHRAERDYRIGQRGRKHKPMTRRTRATLTALKREERGAASSAALARQARQSARRRRALA
jgi:hypothetical protein